MAVDGGLKNHFVARITNLGPPKKTYPYRFNQGSKLGEELVNHVRRQAVRQLLLRTLEHLLIFQKERRSSQRYKPPICYQPKDGVSRSGAGSQGVRHHHGGIEDDPSNYV